MNACLVIALNVLCNPCGPVYTYPVQDMRCAPVNMPVMVYMPFVPVQSMSCVEVKPQTTISEKKPKEEEVLEAVAAKEEEEDSVLTNASLSYPPTNSLGQMALDWGLAGIGSGTLYPNNFEGHVNPAGGGGFFGGGSNTGGGYIPVPSCTPVCYHHCCKPGDGNCPPVVPEPTSIAVFAAGLGAFGFRQWRQKKPDITPAPSI